MTSDNSSEPHPHKPPPGGRITSPIYEPLLKTPEYQQTVARIARYHTRGTFISWEDAAQTAHAKVWQVVQAGKFHQGGVKEFYHWATRVAKHAIIDFVRKHKQLDCESLNQPIPGTNLSRLDTIADDFDLPDAIEYKDLLMRTIEAIDRLDRRYPERGYLKLWRGLVKGKNQSQLAVELCLTQGTISRRWQELSKRVTQELGLLPVDIKELQTREEQRTARERSNAQW